MNQALQYLEHLQEQSYSRLGLSTAHLAAKTASSREIMRDEEQLRRLVETAYPSLPAESVDQVLDLYRKDYEGFANSGELTRYQDFLTYKILQGLREEIVEAARALSLPLPSKQPVIGTMPTGDVNARLIAVPSTDEYIVAFDDGLFTFALLVSKVVCGALPYTFTEEGMLRFSLDDEEVNRKISEDRMIVQRFIEVLGAYTLDKNPSAAPQYFPDENVSALSQQLLDCMETFVIGHEYGHLIAGHLDSVNTEAALIPGETVQEILPSWKQEFEADYLGLLLMLTAQSKKGYDPSLSFWGADYFFSCLEVVERTLSILSTGAEYRHVHSSHPPTEMRREGLRFHLTEFLGEQDAQGPIQLGREVEHIVGKLWEITRPVFQRYHDEGRKAAYAWLL